MTVRILVGETGAMMRTQAAAIARTCVTSPPYWGLRDYGMPPVVFGGDPDCEHAWGGELLDRSRATPGLRGSGLTNAGSAVLEAARFEKRSHFCARCGAWRGQLGLEPTPELYVEHIVGVFREVHRLLRDDGTLWLNLGDCYATGGGRVGEHPGGGEQGARWRGEGSKHDIRKPARPELNGRGEDQVVRKFATNTIDPKGRAGLGPMTQPNRLPIPGLKPKDLVGIPWRVAFALQADGWYLRSDIIWHKPNPMPESITDRPTKSHEYLFLLTKSERYFYDNAAIAEPAVRAAEVAWAGDTSIHSGVSHTGAGTSTRRFKKGTSGNLERKAGTERGCPEGTGSNVCGSVPWEGVTRNKRTVWTVATKPFKGAHFATFPPALIEPCILAGSARGDLVLDPFGGAGTTGLVADRLGRNAVLCELNPEYAAMARKRIDDAAAHGFQEGLDLTAEVVGG